VHCQDNAGRYFYQPIPERVFWKTAAAARSRITTMHHLQLSMNSQGIWEAQPAGRLAAISIDRAGSASKLWLQGYREKQAGNAISPLESSGGPSRTRTCDPLIMRPFPCASQPPHFPQVTERTRVAFCRS